MLCRVGTQPSIWNFTDQRATPHHTNELQRHRRKGTLTTHHYVLDYWITAVCFATNATSTYYTTYRYYRHQVRRTPGRNLDLSFFNFFHIIFIQLLVAS